jgi:hypothetical protein
VRFPGTCALLAREYIAGLGKTPATSGRSGAPGAHAAPPTRVDAARVGRDPLCTAVPVRAMGRTEAELLPIVDSGPGVATYPAGPAGSNLSRYICAGR